MKSRVSRRDSGGQTATRPRAGSWLLLVVVSAAAVVGVSVPARALQAAAAPDVARAEVSGSWTDYDSQPLRVNVWHDGGDDDVYGRGEAVRISFEANRDAYAVVYRIDVDGEVIILWPRSRYDDGFVFGQHQYTLPAAGAPRLRVAQEEGVEYVEAIVSAYPFDLRNLEVDFHHEANDELYGYRVAGDPFLAMNEINYAVTGVESPEDFVVTNYVSYYVGEEVAHPRYLCGQCHTGDPVYDPYQDHCTVTINYDYGWVNRWYVRFGYYPAYYYPVYYYVDPWTWRPWVNYWYTPWYGWPSFAVYDWPYGCYVWNYSPYWQGDVWERWREGDRRYVPLDKRLLQRASDRERLYDRSNQLVRSGRPTREMTEAMERRTAMGRDERDKPGREGRLSATTAVYQNVRPATRERTEFQDAPPPRGARPGLRVREDRGERSVRPEGKGAESRPGTRQLDPRGGVKGERGSAEAPPPARDRNVRDKRYDKPSATGREGTTGSGIRPVEPRNKGARIWSGGRTAAPPERTVRPSPGGRSAGESGNDTGEADKPTSRRAPSDLKGRKGSAPTREQGGAEVSPDRPARSSSERSAPSRRSSSDGRTKSPPSVRSSSPPSERPSSPPSVRPSSPPSRGDRSTPPAGAGGKAPSRSGGGDSRSRSVRAGERS